MPNGEIKSQRRAGAAGGLRAGALGPIAAALAALATGPAMVPAMAQEAGDAARGEKQYQIRCGVCHSLDANGVGPAQRDVYGRKAGVAPDFNYSDAVKALDITWNEETLDAWLQSPPAYAPGTMMVIPVPEAQVRADIIAYLKSVSPNTGE